MSRSRVGGDGGAAALEFALVVPVLLALVFGIIDYGIYFSDSLATRDGVRIAARQGVVQDFEPCQAQTLACLASVAKDQMNTLGGDKKVKISVLDPSGAAAPWTRGNTLLVCAQVASDGVTHLTPLPDGGVVSTKIRMRIEQDNPAKVPTDDGFEDDAITNWDFCT